MYGPSSLLTMKPSVSLQVTGCFPMALLHAIRLSYVSSLVSAILITSTNFMTGTGLKKWRPPHLSLLPRS